MRAPWMGLTASLLLLGSCAGTTTTTVKPVSSTSNLASTPAPKATASVPQKPETQVTVNEPVRDGHAIKLVGMTPATGIVLAVASVNPLSLTYTPDPPDVSLVLSVPDTSLGAVLTGATITYLLDNAPTAVKPIIFPTATTPVSPGDPTTLDVPIGNTLLKQLFTDGQLSGSLTASVGLTDEQGNPVVDAVTGKALAVVVPMTVSGS